MKRWRPRFSIQSLMLLMVIVGLSVGWSIDHQTQSREIRLQTSALQRTERRLGRITNVLNRFQEVLSRAGIGFGYDLDRIRFSVEIPDESDPTKKRTTNLFG